MVHHSLRLCLDCGEDLRELVCIDLRGKCKESEFVWIMVYYTGFARKVY